jgi:5-methyltetrahydropteroyltriglutamate--homocysteine methyltransferase
MKNYARRRASAATIRMSCRIEEATRYVPLEQLALSPQCGFSSTVHGKDLDIAQQTSKLRLVVEIAAEVWGPA